MRVAVVTTSYPETDDDPSGHFVRSEVNELVKQGHQVTVFCPGAVKNSDPRSNPAVVRLGATRLFGWPGALSRLRANPTAIGQLLPFIWSARTALRKGAFDRAIAHWLVPCGWPISNVNACPTEIVVHGSDARLLARSPVWLRDVVLSSLQAKGHTLRFVAAHLKSLLTTPNTQVWIMNSRVTPCAFDLPSLPSRAEARLVLHLTPERFVATVIGRLVPSKRVTVALERAELPSGARVFVIGDGPCRNDLRRRFPNVVFLGQLPRAQTLLWLKASDVLLNASRTEGAPTVVREARALDVTVWAAPCDVVSAWAASDPGICIRSEFA